MNYRNLKKQAKAILSTTGAVHVDVPMGLSHRSIKCTTNEQLLAALKEAKKCTATRNFLSKDNVLTKKPVYTFTVCEYSPW